MLKKHIANRNFLGRLFLRFKYIQFVGSIISLQGSNLSFRTDDISNFISLETYPWGNSLKIISGRNILSIGFMVKSESLEFTKVVNLTIATNIGNRILSIHQHFEQVAEKTYLRDSQIAVLQQEMEHLSADFSVSPNVWNQHLSQDVLAKLKRLMAYLPLKANVNELRVSHERRSQKQFEGFFDQAESHPLTVQQRLAVIRNNDRNLVLAGAGTGKTSVIVAKALYLIASAQTVASDILIVAYNKVAATELAYRFESRAKSLGLDAGDIPKIKTFHALGREILKEANIGPYISDLQEDNKKLKIWVTEWLGNYISENEFGLPEFIKILYEPTNPFEFESKEDYERYVRDNEFRTLQGGLVRGYQELLIANWLFEHSIEYEYEPQYRTKVRVEVGIDYTPDFYLPKIDVYLEHFGIDRAGNTRPDIDAEKYREDMRLKRVLHVEQGTNLIETFHYNWCEGNLVDRLKEQLKEYGLEPEKRAEEEMLNILTNIGLISEKAILLLNCLKAVRVENIDEGGVETRLEEREIGFFEIWAKILNKLVADYLTELRQSNTIDFDDMIIRAADVMKAPGYQTRWRHVLVDEFQDISNARMDFLKAILSSDQLPILTAVGDDWQAIYRFSGGKLQLTTQFETLVGKSTTSKLEKTFRYNNSIAHTAGTFVMRNPEQYTKNIETHDKVDGSRVYLLDERVGEELSLIKKVSKTIATIRKNAHDQSIAVLARYNYLLDQCREENEDVGIENIKYWTFHGAKGLEADNCIIIGFFQGKSGFPNYKQDEAVREALLPLEDSFLHSEERRLLYVALTRSRERSYLIADSTAPSEFILELLAPNFGLNIVSDKFEESYRRMFKCPKCSLGYFVMRKGKYGEFYSCSSGRSCNIHPRKCEKCGAPSLDQRKQSLCNNGNCKHSINICAKCGRPMRIRESQFGKFWSCSGFGIKDDQCKYTERYKV